jgi:hypothetical protein
MKTLVIILNDTRSHELTFNNFKKNVIDELNADLCLCIGVKPDYDYDNQFYKLAKYKFTYNEPDDYSDALDYAYNLIKKPKYEFLNNINALHSKIQYPRISNDNITYYGDIESNIDKINNNDFEDDEIIITTNNYSNEEWKNQIYGIKNSDNNNLVDEENIITLKKPLNWRDVLGYKTTNKDNIDLNKIFYKWFLLKNLIDNNLINEYDRFVITKSDYIYKLPFPKVDKININNIWIPDFQYNNGYSDGCAILSKTNIISYLNIFDNIAKNSNEYFIKMKNYFFWNIELLIKFHLEKNNNEHLVKEFPNIMYSIKDDKDYKNKLEFDKSDEYLYNYIYSGLTIDEFYKDLYDT